jgi:GntR family transcriptional regulator
MNGGRRVIDFFLDARSGVAPYLQVSQQVRHALRLGLLREGDQLPTVKDVVARLAINPNTVLKAYKELEREGLVTARQGVGTFVSGSLAGAPPGAYEPLRRAGTWPAGWPRRAGPGWTTRASRRCSRRPFAPRPSRT